MRDVFRSPWLVLLVGVVWASFASSSAAELYINEIYFDPPASLDSTHEYLELRGTPDMLLDHHYLIFIENEDVSAGTGSVGEIDHIFDLTGKSIGNNGFLTLRQKNSPYTNISPGTNDYVNEGPLPAWGTNPTNNTLNFTSTGLLIENSGFTALLIRNDGDPVTNKPTLGFDLDVGNDGLDHPNGREGWKILDGIGVHSELDETEFGRLYAPINFGYIDEFFPPNWQPNIEPGAIFAGVPYEIEYVGRWGNSTGQTAADWHISNLTNNALAGFMNNYDFRQSGHLHDPIPSDFVETNQSTPYGVNLTATLGAPNYIQGDYNGDGYVNTADYVIWRDMLGRMGNDLKPDANNDQIVNELDYAIWKGRFGQPESAEGGLARTTVLSPVPEPTFMAILIVAGLTIAVQSRRSD